MKPYPSHKKTKYQEILDGEVCHYAEAEKKWKKRMTALKKGYVYSSHDLHLKRKTNQKLSRKAMND